jgi:colanic acid/amylovoran biosynthesis glycosyltransferase
MKILFCTNTFENSVNGPAKFAQQLLQLNDLCPSIELRVLTEDVSPGKTSRFVQAVDLSISGWTRPWGFIYRMFPYYRSCRDLYASFPYDLVVFNNAITGLWSSLRLRQPVIGMVNDDNSCTNSWRKFEFRREWWKWRIFYYFEKLACKLQTATLVNSQYLLNVLQTNYHLNPRNLHRVYKGVTVVPLKEIRPLLPKSPIRVLFVKTDFVRGGLPDLIAALERLSSYQFLLQVAGPREKNFPHITSMLQSSNIVLDLIGPASPWLVSALLHKSDLFIVPSRKEALGVANMEALLAGVPVISTHVGGIPEVLDHGNNGWLVPPSNPAQLATCIETVLRNPTETYRKQLRGRKFVMTNFTHTLSLKRFVRVLKAYHL